MQSIAPAPHPNAPREDQTLTALVTGAGSGIGLAITQAFVAQGMNVVAVGRNEEKLRQAAERIAPPRQVAVVAADITKPELHAQLIDRTQQTFGQIDILVNNAGIFFTKPFTEYSLAELDEFLAYLRGTFALSQAAVRAMRSQGSGGAIINIGTILADQGLHAFPSSAPIAAKGGITALTRNLAIELAADGIRINAVAPGVVPTPLYGELSASQLTHLHAMQPLGRYGFPDDIAEAVLYLATAKWVTGVVLPVDGGVAAGGDSSFHGTHSS